MTTLQEAVTKFLGRVPSDQEMQEYYRARDAFNLKNNDALWLLLIALRHYETLYGMWPTRIREAAKETLADVRHTAQEQMKVAAEVTKRELAEAVAKTAEQVSRDTARTRIFRWAGGSVATSAISLLLLGLLSYRQGFAAGHARGSAEGYARAVDQAAAAAWANTQEGQLAYGLANAGSIRELAACSGRGWIRKAGICYPRPEGSSVYGWRLAPDQRPR